MDSACRVCTHISRDAIKAARAGSRGCLSTKEHQAFSRGTDGSEQVHLKKSAPGEEVVRSKGKLKAPWERASTSWKVLASSCSQHRGCIQTPKATGTCVPPPLHSHWQVSSGFCTACLADRTFTGHVLKAAGSWPGVVQLSSTFQSPFTSFSVPRKEGALRAEGRQGWTAEGQVSWQVSRRRRNQRMVLLPTQARGWAGRLLQVCGRGDRCEHTHDAIYASLIYNMPSVRHACLY